MPEIWRGVWVVGYREFNRILLDRTRLISSFAMPIIFLVIFGAGFSRTVGSLTPGVNFIQFLFPGIVAQTVFMNSVFSGLSIVWDREFGFLKELLVAPISRAGIVGGKVLGGAALAMAQGLIILILAPLVDVTLTPLLVVKLVPLLMLISLSLSSLGILLSARMRSQQGFQVLTQLLIMPMIFLSGVFFPLNNVPRWLEVMSKINPLTYGVDAVRQVFLEVRTEGSALPGGGATQLGVLVFGHRMTVWQDALVMGAVGLALVSLATWAFSRQD